MPNKRLKEFLDSNHVKYSTIRHSPAFTAQEIAASAHIPGQRLAKTVMIKIDGKLAMVVEPAFGKVNLTSLKEQLHANQVELAHEYEFSNKFPGCELGAMPPFGNLYDMDVYVTEDLAEDKSIAFNAGTHSELIKMSYTDFAKLVKPKLIHH